MKKDFLTMFLCILLTMLLWPLTVYAETASLLRIHPISHANLAAGIELNTTVGKWLRLDSSGNLYTTFGTRLTSAEDSIQCLGNVAHDAADAGNPVKIGGRYTTDTVTSNLSLGDRGDMMLDKLGAVLVTPGASSLVTYYNAIGEAMTGGNPALISRIIIGVAGDAASRVDLYQSWESGACDGTNESLLMRLDGSKTGVYDIGLMLDDYCINITGTTAPTVTLIRDTWN